MRGSDGAASRGAPSASSWDDSSGPAPVPAMPPATAGAGCKAETEAASDVESTGSRPLLVASAPQASDPISSVRVRARASAAPEAAFLGATTRSSMRRTSSDGCRLPPAFDVRVSHVHDVPLRAGTARHRFVARRSHEAEPSLVPSADVSPEPDEGGTPQTPRSSCPCRSGDGCTASPMRMAPLVRARAVMPPWPRLALNPPWPSVCSSRRHGAQSPVP